jgi:hypothetical protein
MEREYMIHKINPEPVSYPVPFPEERRGDRRLGKVAY